MGTIISAIIAVVSAIIAITTIIKSYLRVKNSKNITLTKRDGSKLTVHTQYNKADSRRMIEFIK